MYWLKLIKDKIHTHIFVSYQLKQTINEQQIQNPAPLSPHSSHTHRHTRTHAHTHTHTQNTHTHTQHTHTHTHTHTNRSLISSVYLHWVHVKVTVWTLLSWGLPSTLLFHSCGWSQFGTDHSRTWRLQAWLHSDDQTHQYLRTFRNVIKTTLTAPFTTLVCCVAVVLNSLYLPCFPLQHCSKSIPNDRWY